MGASQGAWRQPKRQAALRADGELIRDLELAAKLGVTLEDFYDHPDAEDHIAAWEIEKDRCPHHGGPRSECPDEERDWFPQRTVCAVEKQLKAAQRTFDEIHKDRPFHDGTGKIWLDKWSPLTPFRYDDGVTIWMSPVELNPDDEFLG